MGHDRAKFLGMAGRTGVVVDQEADTLKLLFVLLLPPRV